MDADSVGVNAFLLVYPQKLNASIFVGDRERATRQRALSREEVAAAKMMFLAKKRGSVPKDLGIDLLILKDKRFHEEPYDKKLEAKMLSCKGIEKLEPAILDSKGMFKIFSRPCGTRFGCSHITLHSDRLSQLHYQGQNR